MDCPQGRVYTLVVRSLPCQLGPLRNRFKQISGIRLPVRPTEAGAIKLGFATTRERRLLNFGQYRVPQFNKKQTNLEFETKMTVLGIGSQI